MQGIKERSADGLLMLMASLVVYVVVLGFLVWVGFHPSYSGEVAEVQHDTVWQDRAVTVRGPVASDEVSLGYGMVTLPVRKISTSKSAYLDFDGQKRENVTDTSGILEEFELYDHFRDTTKMIDNDTAIHSSVERIGKDSVEVSLPLTQKIYRDSFYTAYVTGYRIGEYPRLDSLIGKQRTVYVTKTIMQEQKRKPFSLGIGVGYGLCGKQFDPYIGIGVQYKILEF